MEAPIILLLLSAYIGGGFLWIPRLKRKYPFKLDPSYHYPMWPIIALCIESMWLWDRYRQLDQ